MSNYNQSEQPDSNKNRYDNQQGFERPGTNTTMDYYDPGYVYVEQLPLIKLSLTQHYGVELDDKNSIFYFNNSRTLLKPKEKGCLEVCFTTASSECRTYEAIFVGYLNIPANVSVKPAVFIRGHTLESEK